MYPFKFIRKFQKNLKYCWIQIKYILNADKINCFLDVPAKEHQVNIYDYRPDKFGYDLYQGCRYNLGDSRIHAY